MCNLLVNFNLYYLRDKFFRNWNLVIELLEIICLRDQLREKNINDDSDRMFRLTEYVLSRSFAFTANMKNLITCFFPALYLLSSTGSDIFLFGFKKVSWGLSLMLQTRNNLTKISPVMSRKLMSMKSSESPFYDFFFNCKLRPDV